MKARSRAHPPALPTSLAAPRLLALARSCSRLLAALRRARARSTRRPSRAASSSATRRRPIRCAAPTPTARPMTCFAARQIGGTRLLHEGVRRHAHVAARRGRRVRAGRRQAEGLQPDDTTARPGACGRSRPRLPAHRRRVGADEGVCVTGKPCSADTDCHDPVRSTCATTFFKQLYAERHDAIKTDHLYCLQEGCKADGPACSPGEICLHAGHPRGRQPARHLRAEVRLARPAARRTTSASSRRSRARRTPTSASPACWASCARPTSTASSASARATTTATPTPRSTSARRLHERRRLREVRQRAGPLLLLGGRSPLHHARRVHGRARAARTTTAACATSDDQCRACRRRPDGAHGHLPPPVRRRRRAVRLPARGDRPHLPALRRRRRPHEGRGRRASRGSSAIPCFDDSQCAVPDLNCAGVDATTSPPTPGSARASARRTPTATTNRWTRGQRYCGGAAVPVCLPARCRRRALRADKQCQSQTCVVPAMSGAPASADGGAEPECPPRPAEASEMTSRKLMVLVSLASRLAARPRRAARARRREAGRLVLGTTDKDAELADNITEVIIARVAQRGGFEIAGKEEFRARVGVESDQRAQVCLDDLGCLGRAAVSLGVRRIVAGSIGTRGKQFLFSLNLEQRRDGQGRRPRLPPRRGRRRGPHPRRSGGHATSSSSRASSPARSRSRPSPRARACRSTTPTWASRPSSRARCSAGKHNVRVEADARFPWTSKVEVRPGQELQIKLKPDNLPVRRSWPPTVAYGTAGPRRRVAAAGGFLGVLSQLQPTGTTRADAQDDFDQKKRFALAANVSLRRGRRARRRVALLLHPLPRRHLRPRRTVRRSAVALARLASREERAASWPAVGDGRDVRAAGAVPWSTS